MQGKWIQTRRSFLKTVGIGGAALALPSGLFALSALNNTQLRKMEESKRFSLSVACGDVSENGALLWTYTESGRQLALTIWKEKESAFSNVMTLEAPTNARGFSKVYLDFLKANTRYQYAFVELDSLHNPAKRSPIGRFKTAATKEDMTPLVLGATSCSAKWFDPYLLENIGHGSEVDAFMYLGDTSYNDGSVTSYDYQKSWHRSLLKRGNLNLRSQTSILAALDDHEVTNNFDPETIDPAQLEAAMQAFFDNQPIGQHPQHSNRIYRKTRFGKTAEVFTLDCRTERKPSSYGSPNAQYISKEQMNWLKDSLINCDAGFKVIMNSVPIGNFPLPMSSDRWEGFPKQREEILSFIDGEKIEGVLWVSGDFHFACKGRVSKEGPGKNQHEVLAGPIAQMPNPLGLGLNGNSQFEWASIRNNYLMMHFDPDGYKVELIHQGTQSDEAPRDYSETPRDNFFAQTIGPAVINRSVIEF